MTAVLSIRDERNQQSMRAIQRYMIVPQLPDALTDLQSIAHNLRWAWNPRAVDLFESLDPALWESCNHNPVAMLQQLGQGTLDAAADDPDYLAKLQDVRSDLDSYLHDPDTWFRQMAAEQGWQDDRPLVAYFSAEFGLTESLPIFAGGLGILAGDHVKSASDLDVPLIGVGLLYKMGYFRQIIDEQGWQHAAPRENVFRSLPLSLVADDAGAPVRISVDLAGKTVHAQIWKIQVGRAAVYLLDTNVEDNDEEDRKITERLYDGEQRTRIKQEMVLGIGGIRALQALGLNPPVIHLNEGHAAFAALERARMLMQAHDLSFAEASAALAHGTVFTTHTPVAAGHDRFAPALMDYYFNDYWPQLGLRREEFHGLGRENPADDDEQFTMTVLALKLARHCGAVSKLHEETTRKMWQQLWPNTPLEEIPIGHVTNGVHLATWLSPEMAAIYDRQLDRSWRSRPIQDGLWDGLEDVEADELWTVHCQGRQRLIDFTRKRIAAQYQRHNAHPAEIATLTEQLDPDALTIGFARRFATYKRGALILRDPERLARIVNDADRPVQFIFAGKAHPDDKPGQAVIHEILSTVAEGPLRGSIFFLEDYDISIAKHLVQGVDVWLNNPRRPMEASGTSGMKVSANGGLNLSVLDGWWAEAWEMAHEHDVMVGWAIGEGKVYDDPEYADRGDAEAIYQLLERQVVPLFYDRDEAGIPQQWVHAMRDSMRWMTPFFNTNRMVAEYWHKYYQPALSDLAAMSTDTYQPARDLVERKQAIRAAWSGVSVVDVTGPDGAELRAGSEIAVSARVDLAGLQPADVLVELVGGQVQDDGLLDSTFTSEMQPTGTGSPQSFTVKLGAPQGGRFGYTVRVRPRASANGPVLAKPDLVHWATAAG